jgi:two-component system, NtrC family, response regulator PilR
VPPWPPLQEESVGNILVCDDERSICELLDIALRRDGHKVETVTGGEAAKRKVESAIFDVIVTDIKMPNVDGVEVLRHAHLISPETAVILMTAVDDYEAAVQAVKAGGATDYIRKSPGLVDEVKLAIARALEKVVLSRQNFALRRDAAARNSLDNIIGVSPALEKLKQTIRTVASTNSTILVYGESGTGKELVARAVHTCSPRATEAFVSVNCGAFPETLLESELFGYVKGAFTGASQNKRGLFEVADQGTIFLDEIGDMTMPMQVKLLRVLQERTVRPVGGTSEIAVDVRVIAATNRDLDKQVADGTFREDLYYRLSVIPIRVPALRERREDVPLLANHFLKKYGPAAGKSIHSVHVASLEALCGYDWPGNVRQLENTIERAVALELGNELRVELPAERPKTRAAAAGAESAFAIPSGSVLPDGVNMEHYVAQIERSLLQSALGQTHGVQVKAADLLGISYRSFRHLMKKYEL